MDALIEIKNLSFSYRKKKIFDNLNLSLKTGNIYGLLGENGVGKTTLLHLISGLLFPKEGFCRFENEDMFKRNPDKLGKIFFLPEEFDVSTDRIKSYVTYLGKFYPNYSFDTLCHYLQSFELDINSKLSELSYGQKKKTLIAFGLSTHAELVLMDEPTNGLDIPSKTQFRKIIASAANEDSCFVISTHQVRDLENLIDPIVILDSTEVLLNHSVEEITRKLRFSIQPEKTGNTLYSEQVIGGLLTVDINQTHEESKLNLEALFNAVMHNKEKIKEMFNLKTSGHE